jgi:hypothetical protein
MTKLETIPAEEDSTLLPQKPQSTGGIRRVVIAAAVASFVIGVLAATAVRTSPECRSGSPAELRNSDGPCKLGGKEITIQNGEGLCVAASGTKNGKRIIAQKCKAGSSKQQWQIGPM